MSKLDDIISGSTRVTGLGQVAVANGLSGNSSTNPIDLEGATIKATKSTSSGLDWMSLTNGVLGNAAGIIGALNGNATPQNVTNNYNTGNNGSNDSGNGKTMLYVACGVAALVLILVFLKK